MNLPQGWADFYDDVLSRTKTLTNTGVWSSDSTSMLAWLGNFTEDKHKYLAAHILDRLTFRTEKMTISAYRRFFSSYFRSYAHNILGFSGSSIEDWLIKLKEGDEELLEHILFCSVTKAGERGESGGHMIRILSGNIINKNFVFDVDTHQLTSVSGKIILIVDDFVGGGCQFHDFVNSSHLKEAALNNKIIFAPSISYDKGTKFIQSQDYGIDFMPLESLTDNERFFTFEQDAKFVGDDINTEEDVLRCYHEMRRLDSSFKKGHWLGRGKASLCVGFQWGCPNQSLGIIWYEGTNDWHQLLKRRSSV